MTTDAPFACPGCGEERLLEGDARAWTCAVCGQHGPRAVVAAPAPDGLQALLAAVVQRHMPGQWQIVAAAPLVQWPRSLQKELRGTLGALTDTLVIVLERTPS